jgi:peroxiredoxin
VVGVSVDAAATLKAFAEDNKIHHPLLSDFRRQMLPAYGAMVTNENSPVYRYAKRAYFVLDKEGIIRYLRIDDNPLDILTSDQVLKLIKESGV